MPGRRLSIAIILIAAAPLLSACHSAFDEATDSFADARYPTAAAQFRALEPAARALRGRDLANYALHRGLTHLALGDARAAALWLGYAKESADRDPEIFSDGDRGALVAAWRSMGHMPGEPGFNNTGTTPTAAATANSVPAPNAAVASVPTAAVALVPAAAAPRQ